ncbi:hypothetical protein NPX13_g9591 [Xylaria arbuscula]|uniref:Grh/CP2 DB domain-containing protein n=1 Tax=Xylaria arbuscula TaxID=114810 RepID=A0A9W8THC5_9PEZI|nr:hypothetical protein NPX13_g9591 [Xylaria arbuscula]
MFSQRTSSQKPGEELVASFRQHYPNLGVPGAVSSAAASQPPLAANSHASGQMPTSDRHHVAPEAFRDQDPTPRASEPHGFRLTPSLFDTSSSHFNAFLSQPQGLYTPTPGGTNTLYHPQAGDLHTPTIMGGVGINTPLSLSTNDGTIHAGPSGMLDMAHFQQPVMPPQAFYPQQFHTNISPFVHAAPQQPTFAPSSFVHHDTGYETMDHDDPHGSEGRVERMGSLSAPFHSQSPQQMDFTAAQYSLSMPRPHSLPHNPSKFRFLCTLNAATAMIKHSDEIPVTYLNKGQVYSLNIVDTSSQMPVPGTKYRTFIRISFEDEQQRQRPGACWTLWKDGRGLSEAYHRDGKLLAVEYVESGSQPAEGDDRKTRIQLEQASFDGFCVTWTPGANNGNGVECTIQVRFNFLSTDFSHSKGVKGIPVRLCAKTSVASTAESPPPEEPVFEICYCKVKLFRDHGAERKLANDVLHVKKTIEKLTQQLNQAQAGGKDFGKRKRGNAHAKAQDHQRSGPGKAPKHKRTWSMSSASSADGGTGGNPRSSVEDELVQKLQNYSDMFSSNRSFSILYLRGDESDDPDTHPVALAGGIPDASGADLRDRSAWRSRSERNSVAESNASPSPSSVSIQSQATGATPWLERRGGNESRRMSDQPVKVQVKSEDDGNLSCWIEALGVDHSYQPPAEKPPKSIAVFYIKKKPTLQSETSDLHKAVYLSERTLSNFVSRVLAKWNLDATRFTRAVRILEGDLVIEMDNDVIRELSEGQAMTLEVAEVQVDMPQPNTDWDLMPVEVPEMDGNSAHSAYRTTAGYELRFSF